MALNGVTYTEFKDAVRRASRDAIRNRNFKSAAALSYYSIFCIFPALIFLSAIMAYIPLPNYFPDALGAMGRVMPDGTMPIIYSVLIGVLGANLRAWLSFATLGTLWVVSSAFDEMIDSLDTAYDVTDRRPMWRTRLLAAGLALLTGVLLMVAIAALVVGPEVGSWMAVRTGMPEVFLLLWPLVHGAIAIGFAVLAVQTIYWLAPNVKHRFRSSLPGAVFCVACCMVLSYLLGIYFRFLGNYNRIYGTLGGVMALLTWLYWAYFIFLVGGELNAELAKESRAR
jgi:membrane protein